MSQVTLNPFSTIGTEFSSGLGTIITAFPAGMTFNQLLPKVETIVAGIYYPSPNTQLTIEIGAIGVNAVNSYVNDLLGFYRATYNTKQLKFINMLVGSRLTSNLSPLSLNNWILNVEDNITESDLTVAEQIPLLLATMVGETAYTYWTTDVAAGSPSWVNYYQSQQPENYANISSWISSAMEGALVGYGANVDGLIEPTTNNVTTRMVAALCGSLAVNAAKVALQIEPRIQPMEIC